MRVDYANVDKFVLAVDSVIFGYKEGKLQILLIKRKYHPEFGSYSLMGGFLKTEENADEAAQIALLKLTGMSGVFLEQMQVFSAVDRDPGYRVIAIGYYALIRVDDYDRELADSHGAEWFDIDNYPKLVFDHGDIVEMALRKLQVKSRYRPIGFELLPEKFTLTQLQQLYEAILRKDLDKRNFRRKILAMGVLRKLQEIDKISSKRGAALFQFDEDEYMKKIDKGFNFEI